MDAVAAGDHLRNGSAFQGEAASALAAVYAQPDGERLLGVMSGPVVTNRNDQQWIGAQYKNDRFRIVRLF